MIEGEFEDGDPNGECTMWVEGTNRKAQGEFDNFSAPMNHSDFTVVNADGSRFEGTIVNATKNKAKGTVTGPDGKSKTGPCRIIHDKDDLMFDIVLEN